MSQWWKARLPTSFWAPVYHLAGPQVCLGVFRERAHLVGGPTEQNRDQVDCGHGYFAFLVNLGSLYRLIWGQPWFLQPT